MIISCLRMAMQLKRLSPRRMCLPRRKLLHTGASSVGFRPLGLSL